MTEDVHLLRALHDDLRSGRFSGNRYDLLHSFGNAGFVEARSTVEGFLTNADPQLRYIALNVLVLHWSIPEYREKALQMLKEDDDSDVRRLAARCLGTLFANSRSVDAFAALLAAMRSEGEEWDVRDAAYSAVLEVLGVPRDEWPSKTKLNWPEDVNWSRVREAEAIVKDSYAS